MLSYLAEEEQVFYDMLIKQVTTSNLKAVLGAQRQEKYK